MGPFPQCRASGFSKRLTPRLPPRANACKYTKLLQGRGGGKGLIAGGGGRVTELPHCPPSSVLLGRSQLLMKCSAPGKSMVFGSNTGLCLFLALRPRQMI